MIIRPAEAADAAAVQAIYGHHVLHGTGTFEEEPPSIAEIERRMTAIVQRGLPYLIAEIDGQAAGFAYAGPFRLRAAYRYTAEDSIYVHPERLGQGVGRPLLEAVVEACRQIGLHQLLAVIGDSANAGSIGVHRACGFELMGVTEGLGFKHGRWVDVVWMQKALNGGADVAPAAAGLDLGGA
ncbi:MAG TPA: GNAT family N-acetyltransferase [Caulobacteraceae bacterium]|nr:GNAT family N-acetyltransferase [Caulobacteraceae bacterium]